MCEYPLLNGFHKLFDFNWPLESNPVLTTAALCFLVQ